MSSEPHGRHVAVWDVPPAIECGARFRVTAGLKCTLECPPDDWRLVIRDHAGNECATATLGGAPWPGTAALYVTQIELRAPAAEGRYAWELSAPATDDASHGGAVAPIHLTIVPAPECRLHVIAIDRERQVPVAGARVVVHPYRAVTDERGIAELRLPRGRYRLFVSGGQYFPFRSDGEVSTDMTITAELEADVAPGDADLWG